MLDILDGPTSRQNPRPTSSTPRGLFMNPSGTIQTKWIRTRFVVVLFGDDVVDGVLETAAPTTLRGGLRQENLVRLLQTIHCHGLGRQQRTHDDEYFLQPGDGPFLVSAVCVVCAKG